MQSRKSKALIGLVGVLSLSLLAAGPAAANVPKFKPQTIVPGQSIGGVEIGMTKKQAVGVWGKPDRCQAEQDAKWCVFNARSTLSNGFVTQPQPFAGFYVRSGKVIVVHVDSAENAAVDPKVNRLKTSKKIGITSKMSAARRAYNLPPPSGGEAGESRALYKQKRRCTLFYAPQSPYEKIESISVGKCNANLGGL
jgi:hypothetical protein